MKKIIYRFKSVITCLLLIICLGQNFNMVVNATENTELDDTKTTDDANVVDDNDLDEQEGEAEVETEKSVTKSSAAESAEGSVYAIISVDDYTIEGGMIEAGKEITINLNIKNTATSASASSVMLTLTNSTGSIYPAYGNDNQIYIGTIGAGKTKEVSIPMTIGSSFTGSAVDLTCQFDYETMGSKLSNASTIVIPSSGGSTIGVKSIDVSSHAIVNGKSLLSVSYVNQSSANITDAEIVIDGNVSKSSKVIKLDTVYAGKSYTQDYYVTFKKAGNQQINISLKYTDIDGEETITDLGSFGVTVSEENAVGEKTNVLAPILLWGGRVVAVVAMIFACMAVVLYIKKR